MKNFKIINFYNQMQTIHQEIKLISRYTVLSRKTLLKGLFQDQCQDHQKYHQLDPDLFLVLIQDKGQKYHMFNLKKKFI
jgi:hypothetical protein